jgi:hypothetical protein
MDLCRRPHDGLNKRSFNRMTTFFKAAVLSVLILAGSVSAAAAQGVGLKFGPTFTDFSSDALDFDTRTGWHAGLFIGGNRDGVVGVQTEINWIRKQVEQPLAARDIRIDYLQIPLLLRVNIGGGSANAFRLFGVGGAGVNIKIGDEVEGVIIDDRWEGADVPLLFGGGIEVARIIVEGRYEKGFRRINKLFSDFTDVKSQSFTILFGVRFR